MTKVKRFDFSEAEPSRVWLIVGARNTGETVLLRDILYKKNVKFAVAMTTTVRTAKMLKKVLPPKLVHSNGCDPEYAEKFLQSMQQNASSKWKVAKNGPHSRRLYTV